jgi:outer membrane protein OmpA-like peptidoglycan-associated protein
MGDKYDFAVTAGEKGYSYYSDFFDLDTLKKYKMMNLDIKLQPLKINTVFPAKNISFENNTEELSTVSVYELERIMRLLKENPTLVIELGVYTSKIMKDTISHDDLSEVFTDNSDTSNIKTVWHNDKTQKQSDALVSYLSQKGISIDRVKAKAYADQKSMIPGFTPSGKQWVEIKVIKE